MNFDVVIIGNGVLGLSTAYALVKRDPKLKIAVVGPSHRKGAATTAAGAMINVWAEIAAGQFENDALADRAKLGMAAFDLWDPLCEELSEHADEPLSVKWGTHVINTALSSPREWTALTYIIEAMSARGVKHEVLGGADVPWLKPAPRAALRRAVLLPDGHINPQRVLTAYERTLDRAGAKRIDATVERVSLKGGRSTVLSNDETLFAKHIVLANGSYAQQLIDRLPELRRETPRLVWGAGSALEVSMPNSRGDCADLGGGTLTIDSVVRTVDRGAAGSVHLIPFGDGEFYLGAASDVRFEPEAKPRVDALQVLMRSLVEEINTAFSFATCSIRDPGFRPTAIDTFPLLGQSHIDGVWFANGTRRDGFTCSPFIGRELASAILGGKSALPERFRPSRPLISYKTREAALDDSVIANCGGEAQNGLALPPYVAANHERGTRAPYEAIYDKRGITEFGIHPEVVHLYDVDDVFAAIDHPREKP